MPWAAISLLRRRFRAPYWHLKRSGRTAASYCSATKQNQKPYFEAEGCLRSASTSLQTTEVSRDKGGYRQGLSCQGRPEDILVGFGYSGHCKLPTVLPAPAVAGAMIAAPDGCGKNWIEGVIRFAISSIVPTIAGRPALLLDVGLNVDCKPGSAGAVRLIGLIYAEAVLGIGNPRVAVPNIGEGRRPRATPRPRRPMNC